MSDWIVTLKVETDRHGPSDPYAQNWAFHCKTKEQAIELRRAIVPFLSSSERITILQPKSVTRVQYEELRDE